jgi:hypothetical protein
MSNALSPDRMTAAERLDEVAEILAAGFMRMRSRKSSPLSAGNGESFLDFPPHRSGHAEHRDGKGDPA